MVRRLVLGFTIAAALGGGLAVAQTARSDAQALALAKGQARDALARSKALEREAEAATSEAARARAESSRLVARIEASEADITGAEARLRIVERLRAGQRARLAEKQEPVVRLTAALQTLGRRPPALALVQPGSLDNLVHVRALLASTLPVVRRRTAALRDEVEAGNRLQAQARQAVGVLRDSREELKQRRTALAAFETRQRRRSQTLAESALFESDRALALGEEARELTAQMGTHRYQERLRGILAALPPPRPRPTSNPAAPTRPPGPRYALPVEGRLVIGMGEIADAGVHARGLSLVVPANAPIIAPAKGRVAYAGRFRGYDNVVIIDHGGGWSSVVTNVGALAIRRNDEVARGQLIGRTGPGETRVTVELRQGSRPVAIAPLLPFG